MAECRFDEIILAIWGGFVCNSFQHALAMPGGLGSSTAVHCLPTRKSTACHGRLLGESGNVPNARPTLTSNYDRRKIRCYSCDLCSLHKHSVANRKSICVQIITRLKVGHMADIPDGCNTECIRSTSLPNAVMVAVRTQSLESTVMSIGKYLLGAPLR